MATLSIQCRYAERLIFLCYAESQHDVCCYCEYHGINYNGKKFYDTDLTVGNPRYRDILRPVL